MSLDELKRRSLSKIGEEMDQALKSLVDTRHVPRMYQSSSALGLGASPPPTIPATTAEEIALRHVSLTEFIRGLDMARNIIAEAHKTLAEPENKPDGEGNENPKKTQEVY